MSARLYVTLCIAVFVGMMSGGCADAHRRIEVGEGVKIDVWVIESRTAKTSPQAQARKTALLLHPLLVDKTYFLGLGRRLAEDGWDVVLPDLRGHGWSGGKHVTWGAKEKHDLKKVIDSLVDEGLICPRVYVMGASLGGCVGVQYAAVDPRCRGVLALSPPTGLRGYIEITTRSTKAWKEARVRRHARRGGYDPEEASAMVAAGKLECPLIVVYGEDDAIVPASQPKAVYDAATVPDKRLIAVPGAGHAGLQLQHGMILEQMRALVGMASAPQPVPSQRERRPAAR